MVPVIFEIAFVVYLDSTVSTALANLKKLRESQSDLMHLNNHLGLFFQTGLLILDEESFRRPDFKEKYARLRVSIEEEIKRLRGNSDFQEIVDELDAGLKLEEKILHNRAKVLAAAGADVDVEWNDAALFFISSKSANDQLIAKSKSVESLGLQLLKESQAKPAKAAYLVLFLSGLITLFVMLFFTMDIVRRLRAITGNAMLIASSQNLPPQQEGTDEIAQLDGVLHQTSARLKEIRRKELAILDNAAGVVCSADRNLRLTAVGAASKKVWGYEPGDLLGKSILTLVEPDTVLGTRQGFDEIASTKKEGEVANIIRCSDGSLKDSCWIVNWARDKETYYCVVHDVTEFKKINVLKQRFLSMVSHDLRSPIASINVSLANLSLGTCGEMNPRITRLLTNSQRSMARLTTLVNDLLELDKLESGAIKLKPECISLSEQCDAAIASLQSLADQRRVTLIGPTRDAAVVADEDRIVQVLVNLIANAIKFSPDGSSVRVEIDIEKDSKVRVDVVDSGPGISLEKQALLFNRFHQVKSEGRFGAMSGEDPLRLKGTGLGLAIAKAIIHAHNGEIGVASELGQGATFWFKLAEFREDLT